ncbi:hypothetical protein Hanom_Chr05g00469391 [Helianthus anomalus]
MKRSSSLISTYKLYRPITPFISLILVGRGCTCLISERILVAFLRLSLRCFWNIGIWIKRSSKCLWLDLWL